MLTVHHRYIFPFFFIMCLAPALRSQTIDPYHFNGKKRVVSTHGAVVSAHALASAAGVQMLKAGGNAIDAAISTQLALAVVYPAAGNIGGGGFMVARLSSGKFITLDYREKAPQAATKNMYLDSQGTANTDLSQNGHLAAGVPGTIAGLFSAAKYGKLPFRQLIQPAIDLAQKGFCLSANDAADLNDNQADFIKYNTVVPAFVRAGGWKAGDTLIQLDLASTLMRIRDSGAAGFYAGETAQLIVAEMNRGKGLITAEDLLAYTAKEREPSIFVYKKDYTIITMPLPSSGGVMLPQMMGMIESQPLKSYGFESVKAVQLMTEVERRAYADRAKYLGDRDFFKVPVMALTSTAYLRDRMKDYRPGIAGNSKIIKEGIVSPEHEETTHLDVYDSSGNAVSITTTLNGGYGSHTVVGGAGFLLNNEMDDFSVKPGVPNMYGAVGGDANAIAGGKRMLSSMSPTIVLKNKKPFLIIGTPGGTTIISSVFQTLVDMLEFNLSADDAVNKPKFHHQWLPDEIFVEHTFPKLVRAQLVHIGYKVTERESIGRFEVIRISDGKIEAVADHRGDDAAEGY